jgi:hypothetical protein
MSGEADFTVKAEPDDFKNTLFLAMDPNLGGAIVTRRGRDR